MYDCFAILSIRFCYSSCLLVSVSDFTLVKCKVTIFWPKTKGVAQILLLREDIAALPLAPLPIMHIIKFLKKVEHHLLR